jgi:NADPH-dependent ferric siderophore reductase
MTFSAAADHIAWNPAAEQRLLLAGTERDVAAISAVLDGIPRESRGQVFIEVESERDIVPLDAPGRFTVTWLVRDRGQELRRSVDAWLSEMLPTSGLDEHAVYAWISTEGPARVLSSN